MLALSVEAVWATICGRASVRSLIIGWSSTLLVWGIVLLQLQDFYTFEEYYFLIAWLMVVGVLIAGQRIRDSARQLHWRVIGLSWGFLVSCTWLFGTYLVNRSLGFHLAVLGTLVVLIACKIFFRLSGFTIRLVNTLILALIILPLTDAILRPSYRLDTRPETGRHYYSYKAARKDPVSFGRWWYYFVQQWEALHKVIGIRDPQHITPYVFRPNSHARIFESEVSINSLGFRGPEIKLAKGNAYRIVALGESTTFGCTLFRNDKSWPRLLEQMLLNRLAPGRPIQVVNAGVYGLTLWDNLHRMAGRILPLRPDMIISYHGYNGFSSFNTSVPLPLGKAPPLYIPRPLKLLADVEYRFKVMNYNRNLTAGIDLDDGGTEDPMESKYASAYEQLIQVAQTNGIHLIVANYSMAVNSHSDSDIIEFYRAGFPSVLDSIQANGMHSRLVAQLAAKHPEVCLVNTHPGLDGEYEKFIDLVHFTQEGRQQLAETFFRAIKDIVAKDLAKLASPGATVTGPGNAVSRRLVEDSGHASHASP
jgi:lysophospholipase L1-like esterase